MAKIESLSDVTGNQSSAHNANNDRIEAAFQNTLSRDGTVPNGMDASLDMDGHFILNLPTPSHNSHAATKAYVDGTATAHPSITQANVGAALWPQTQAENDAGVTPVDYAYPPGNIYRYGAAGDGVTNDTSALQAAIDANDLVTLPAGTFLISGEVLTSKTSIAIQGSGTSSVLDFNVSGHLYIKSTLSSLPDLSADIDAGTNTVGFATAHGLVENDVFLAYNSTDYSFGAARSYYRDGCMFRVSEATSSTALKTYGIAQDTYASGSMSMYKINGGAVTLRDFRVTPPSSGIGIWLDAHTNVQISGLEIEAGAADTAIELLRCFDIDVRNVKATARGGNAYPIIFSNCQKATISNCNLYSTRHALALGGRNEDGAVPTRDILVDQCILKNDGTLGIGAADMHGNCCDVIYSQCLIDSLAQMSGKNASYIGCKIQGRPPAYYADGCCVYGSEISGGVFRIENCELVTWGDLTTFGGVHLSVKDITEDFRLVIHGCRLDNKATSPTTARVVTLVIGESSPPSDWINVDIRDLTYSASAPASQLLYLSGANDISAKCTIIIDDILAPAESAFVGASNASNYAALMRLQAQTFSETVTTPGSSSATATTSLWTYRYPYPRIPTIYVTGGSSDGTTLQTAVRGGKVCVPFAREYTTQEAYLSVHTSDNANFSSSEGVRIHGRVEICEL